ncbi:MAG: orotidine-5'-phosphate decarboxylase, partial [Candidatus Zixiibacteriota bacterium]
MIALTNLQKAQSKNKSIICLGLDPDPRKIPGDFGKTTKGMFDFLMRIIDATSDVVCAYKPNAAFYESLGTEGWSLLKLVCDRIPEDVPLILDAKRGDIGNTAQHYANAIFDRLHADWVTLNPYMGYDSLRPFLDYKDKGVFILCLTSNNGAKDFQMLQVDGKPLYHVVAERVAEWNKEHTCGLVVGATHSDQLRELREVAGDMPLLIPGVGAQGGSLEDAAVLGTDGFRKTALINVSRSVLYASEHMDFAQRARAEIIKLNSAVDVLRRGETETPATESQPIQRTQATANGESSAPPDNADD